MARSKRPVLILLFLLVGLVLGVASVHAQEEFKETYVAFAVAMGTSNPPIIPSGVSTTIEFNITRWSTDEEREGLFAALVEKGPEGIADALSKQKETGWARACSSGGPGMGMGNSFPSERLRYARQFDLGEGKRRIVLGLDRFISMWEQVSSPRWRDYDVSLIIMDIDAEGNGQGQLAMGVRLNLNLDQEKNTLVIENLGTEPVRLNRIRKR